MRAVAEPDAEAVLRSMVQAVDVPVVVHCCAAEVPVAMAHRAGAAAVSLDLAVAHLDLDVLGPAVEAGLQLWAGVVPALGPGVPPSPRDVVEPVRRLWRDLGLPAEQLLDRVALTPACGLAGASSGWARTAMQLVRQAARVLAEEPARA